jgi:lysophospholipase L1-like esterase
MNRSILDPVMRTDEHFTLKHKSFLELIQRQAIDVLFLGDSITRRWEDNIEVWNTYFQNYKAANFGVGQDCLENLKWRILNGELDGIHPKIVLLMIGTNNLDKNPSAVIIRTIKDIVSIIESKLPDTRIILQGIYPRCEDEKKLGYMKSIRVINASLKRAYAFSRIRFFDVGKTVFMKNGQIDTDLLEDGLHPNKKGYQALGPEIKKIIDRYY